MEVQSLAWVPLRVSRRGTSGGGGGGGGGGAEGLAPDPALQAPPPLCAALAEEGEGVAQKVSEWQGAMSAHLAEIGRALHCFQEGRGPVQGAATGWSQTLAQAEEHLAAAFGELRHPPLVALARNREVASSSRQKQELELAGSGQEHGTSGAPVSRRAAASGASGLNSDSTALPSTLCPPAVVQPPLPSVGSSLDLLDDADLVYGGAGGHALGAAGARGPPASASRGGPRPPLPSVHSSLDPLDEVAMIYARLHSQIRQQPEPRSSWPAPADAFVIAEGGGGVVEHGSALRGGAPEEALGDTVVVSGEVFEETALRSRLASTEQDLRTTVDELRWWQAMAELRRANAEELGRKLAEGAEVLTERELKDGVRSCPRPARLPEPSASRRPSPASVPAAEAPGPEPGADPHAPAEGGQLRCLRKSLRKSLRLSGRRVADSLASVRTVAEGSEVAPASLGTSGWTDALGASALTELLAEAELELKADETSLASALNEAVKAADFWQAFEDECGHAPSDEVRSAIQPPQLPIASRLKQPSPRPRKKEVVEQGVTGAPRLWQLGSPMAEVPDNEKAAVLSRGVYLGRLGAGRNPSTSASTAAGAASTPPKVVPPSKTAATPKAVAVPKAAATPPKATVATATPKAAAARATSRVAAKRASSSGGKCREDVRPPVTAR